MVKWSIIGKTGGDFQRAEQIIIKFPIKLVFKLKEKAALRLLHSFGSYDATDRDTHSQTVSQICLP